MSETRFEFGENWKSFLKGLDQHRINVATDSIRDLLQLNKDDARPLAGKRFLDIGSGSGLFSLAAHRLGAHVVSIDFDPECVSCTQHLHQLESDGQSDWYVRRGSVLDDSFMETLGHFDIVYSWGVLHHTGQMDCALASAVKRVAAGGCLAIAIYNDQGGASRRWLWIKQTYHRLPRLLRGVWVAVIAGFYECKFAIARLARFQNPLPFSDWKQKRLDRGMSAGHDWVDWIGGMPFEVARPESIIVPLAAQGFRVTNLKTVGGGWGCNEYVFRHDETIMNP